MRRKRQFQHGVSLDTPVSSCSPSSYVACFLPTLACAMGLMDSISRLQGDGPRSAFCSAQGEMLQKVLRYCHQKVADAGQGLIHPYKLYFPCTGGRDSETSCLLSESLTLTFCSGWQWIFQCALGNARIMQCVHSLLPAMEFRKFLMRA